MEKSELALLEAQAQIMKALSHPTRLFIVNKLAGGEKCVCELTEMVGVDTSTISKHLSIMKSAGIVGFEKRGTSMYYALKMKCVLNFFTCINEVLKKNVEAHMVFRK
jgi:DNA-binding transcriptional ArsR family regulator